jgi:hypothetical protein
MSLSAGTLEKEDERREEPPGREAEEEARRWPALTAVLCRVMSFSEGVASNVRTGETWIGDARGGGGVGRAAWLGGDRW